MKKYTGLLWLLGFLVLMFVLTRRPALVDGTELGFRLPPGAPKGTEDVVRARVAALGRGGEVSMENDLLLIRIPDATAEDVADVKRLLRRKGSLEFRMSAERDVQEDFKRSGVVPEGWEAVDHDRKDGEYGAWTPKMLIRKACVLEGGRVIHAEPRSELRPGGTDWYVAFELDAKAAKKFDEAAAVLYERRPTGLLAIVLDGKLNSAPAVQTNAFGGSGRITGVGGERECRELAIVLVTGPLPTPLEQPPEFERPYQKTR